MYPTPYIWCVANVLLGFKGEKESPTHVPHMHTQRDRHTDNNLHEGESRGLKTNVAALYHQKCAEKHLWCVCVSGVGRVCVWGWEREREREREGGREGEREARRGL
jgi:hypothetical protein